MPKISLVVFDLSGTTVSDDNAVAKSLYEAWGMELKRFFKGATIRASKWSLIEMNVADLAANFA